jgi:hypothetical protein
VLLDFHLRSIRVMDEALEDSVGAAALDGDIVAAQLAEPIGESAYVVDFEAKMPEEAFIISSVWLLEEFEEGAVTGVQEESIAFPGRVAEFMRDGAAHHLDIKTFGGGQVARAEAGVREAFDAHGLSYACRLDP